MTISAYLYALLADLVVVAIAGAVFLVILFRFFRGLNKSLDRVIEQTSQIETTRSKIAGEASARIEEVESRIEEIGRYNQERAEMAAAAIAEMRRLAGRVEVIERNLSEESLDYALGWLADPNDGAPDDVLERLLKLRESRRAGELDREH